LPAPIVNEGEDSCWKRPDFRLWKGCDLDLRSGHTAYHRAPLIYLYLHAKCHWNQRGVDPTIMYVCEETYSIAVDDINNGNELASIWTKCNVCNSSNLNKPCVCLQHSNKHSFTTLSAVAKL